MIELYIIVSILAARYRTDEDSRPLINKLKKSAASCYWGREILVKKKKERPHCSLDSFVSRKNCTEKQNTTTVRALPDCSYVVMYITTARTHPCPCSVW